MNEPVTRAAARMGAAAAVSRVFGGVRVAVIAAVLGTTALGDTFQSSNSVSNVLFELLAAGALSAVLVPAFVDHFEKHDDAGAEEVAGGVLTIAVLGLLVVSVIGVVAAPALARVLTSAVDDPTVAAQQRELATFLLRFFVPQIVLYAVGTVATAVLNAKGSFSLPAAAPIGNTVLLVASMVLFRVMAGSEPGLDITTGEQIVLGLGGTLGVAAFVGVPAMALRMKGFRMRVRPRAAWRDPRVRSLLRLSGWAVIQHAASGLLLITAIVVGGGVAGGVVAYQFAFVVFLTPYGVLAQPILTTILPVMARHASADNRGEIGKALRWALASMAAVTLPVSAACVALSVPIMTVLAFGRAADGDGPELLGAALASLGAGLLPYGAFLLLARGWYVLGDSRTPAIAVAVTSLVGAGLMVAGGLTVDGPERLLVLGGAHSVTFLLAAVWLAVRLRPEVGPVLDGDLLRPIVLAAAVGGLAWVTMQAWDPDGRMVMAAALAAVSAMGAGLYWLGLRATGGTPA
jgi:putative peptidoglycan lipid II flippase